MIDKTRIQLYMQMREISPTQCAREKFECLAKFFFKNLLPPARECPSFGTLCISRRCFVAYLIRTRGFGSWPADWEPVCAVTRKVIIDRCTAMHDWCFVKLRIFSFRLGIKASHAYWLARNSLPSLPSYSPVFTYLVMVSFFLSLAPWCIPLASCELLRDSHCSLSLFTLMRNWIEIFFARSAKCEEIEILTKVNGKGRCAQSGWCLLHA